MKMATVSVVCVFLLCCFSATSATSQGCDQYAVTDGSVNVRLDYKLTNTERSLKWMFKGSVILYTTPTEIATGKKDNINPDGSLKLTKVKKDQAGIYTPEIYDKEGKSKNVKKIRLCVRDPVKKPKVNFTCKEEKVKFQCILGQQPEHTTHEWLRNGGTSKDKGLSFEMNAKNKADKIACKVSNEADSKTSEAVTHNCVISSLPGLPDELFGISIWVFIGGGGGIVLLLIILVIVCCISSRRRRILRLKDEEELRLEWTNTEQHNHHHPLPPLPNNPPHHHHHHHHNHQQQHHHHHHQQQQQQAPGNTGPRQSRSKQNRQPRAKAPEPNGQPQPSPRRTVQAEKPANNTDDEQPPPLPQPRKKNPKKQVE